MHHLNLSYVMIRHTHIILLLFYIASFVFISHYLFCFVLLCRCIRSRAVFLRGESEYADDRENIPPDAWQGQCKQQQHQQQWEWEWKWWFWSAKREVNEREREGKRERESAIGFKLDSSFSCFVLVTEIALHRNRQTKARKEY